MVFSLQKFAGLICSLQKWRESCGHVRRCNMHAAFARFPKRIETM